MSEQENGPVLANGAQSLEWRWISRERRGAERPWGVVLARQDPRTAQPWATWLYVEAEDGTSDCLWGHYFETLTAAAIDFTQRVGDALERDKS